MAIGLRGGGTIDDSFPLNPSFPAGGQAQDLNILTLITYGVTTFFAADGNGGVGNGVWQRPVTPSGWTLLFSPTHETFCTYQFFPGLITVYQYVRVGAFSGSLGNISFTGPGSQPDRAMCGIDIFSCGASETWDYTVFGHGHDIVDDFWYDSTASQLGTQRSGRIDPGPGDWQYIITSMNAANAAYPILDPGNTIYNPGAGVSGGTHTNIKTDWMTSTGFGDQNEGLTLIRSYYAVGAAKAPYGSPRIQMNTYNPAKGSTYTLRLALRDKTSIDARPVVDKTKLFGLTSEDVGRAIENPKIPALNIPGTIGNYASTPDNAALDIVGDIDIRADVALDDWSSGVYQILIGKWTTGQLSYRLAISDAGFMQLAWTVDGTNALAAGSEVVSPGLGGRLAVRATLDVNNGASGHTVTWYTARTMAGPWVQLGAQSVGGGVTSIFSGSAPLDIGQDNDASYEPLIGAIYSAEIRNTIGGTVVANPDFTAQTPGTLSFADTAGRTWTVKGTAAIADVMGSALLRTTPAVPYPRRWKNGDVPLAAILNNDWRDGFKWLLGYTKPWFAGISTDTANWVVGSWHSLPINTELIKQGGMIHATNDTRIYVPEDGWYEYMGTLSRDSTSAGTTNKDWAGLGRNGNIPGVIMGSHSAHIVEDDMVHVPDQGSLYLSAGDYVQFQVWSTAPASSVKNWSSPGTQFHIWWAER